MHEIQSIRKATATVARAGIGGSLGAVADVQSFLSSMLADDWSAYPPVFAAMLDASEFLDQFFHLLEIVSDQTATDIVSLYENGEDWKKAIAACNRNPTTPAFYGAPGEGKTVVPVTLDDPRFHEDED